MKQVLIDAIKLRKDLPKNADYYEALAWIDEAEEVEAIPIVWIKEWLENIKNDKRYKSEYVELTKEVKQVEYKGTALIRIPCISDMLDDWEKENGKDSE